MCHKIKLLIWATNLYHKLKFSSSEIIFIQTEFESPLILAQIIQIKLKQNYFLFELNVNKKEFEFSLVCIYP